VHQAHKTRDINHDITIFISVPKDWKHSCGEHLVILPLEPMSNVIIVLNDDDLIRGLVVSSLLDKSKKSLIGRIILITDINRVPVKIGSDKVRLLETQNQITLHFLCTFANLTLEP
jgi:hypothetical protein